VDCSKIKIASIDDFPGNVRDYIILSLTRTNSESLSDFFVDWRRVNVSLTRTKYGIIINGNSNSFRGMNHEWGRLCDYCYEMNFVHKNFINTLGQKKKIPKKYKTGKDSFYDILEKI